MRSSADADGEDHEMGDAAPTNGFLNPDLEAFQNSLDGESADEDAEEYEDDA